MTQKVIERSYPPLPDDSAGLFNSRASNLDSK